MCSKIFQKGKHKREEESGLREVLPTHCQPKNLSFDTPTHTHFLEQPGKRPPQADQGIACKKNFRSKRLPFLLKTEALNYFLNVTLPVASSVCLGGGVPF